MFASPLRFCGPIKNINCIFAIGNSNFGQIIALIGRRHFASDKDAQGKCCKDIIQTKGKRVEPWPKQEPQLPPCWRCECSREPQPPNYDPYRIKVPDVVVPPLPPSNAKELPADASLFRTPDVAYGINNRIQDLFHNSPIIHPDYWKAKREKRLSDVVKDILPKLGYHGRNKYKYAFHEPWNPLDRLALLEKAEKEEVGVDEKNVS